MMQEMETLSTLLAFCEGNPTVTGEFLAQRSVTQSFEIFFDLHLNKWLSKQSGLQWFRRHWTYYDVTVITVLVQNISHYMQADRRQGLVF